MMRPFTSILAALMLPASLSAATGLTGIPAEGDAALGRGEPYVYVWNNPALDDGAMDVLGIVDIMAPPALIWNVMTDCDRAKEIVDEMKSCEVLDRAPDGSWDIRQQKMRVNFLMTSTSVFRSDYDHPLTIEISGVGGDMKVQQGVWSLTSLGSGKTRVTYNARSAPKFPVPKSSLKKAMSKDVPRILINLRKASESDFKSLQAN